MSGLYSVKVFMREPDSDTEDSTISWDEKEHRTIEVTIDFDPEGPHGLSPDQVLAGYQRLAGQLARLVVHQSHWTRAIAGHSQCKLIGDGVCTYWIDDGVIKPLRAVEDGYVPNVALHVRADEADKWLAITTDNMSGMIAHDLRSAPASSQPNTTVTVTTTPRTERSETP